MLYVLLALWDMHSTTILSGLELNKNTHCWLLYHFEENDKFYYIHQTYKHDKTWQTVFCVWQTELSGAMLAWEEKSTQVKRCHKTLENLYVNWLMCQVCRMLIGLLSLLHVARIKMILQNNICGGKAGIFLCYKHRRRRDMTQSLMGTVTMSTLLPYICTCCLQKWFLRLRFSDTRVSSE